MNINKLIYQILFALVVAVCASFNAHALSADSYASESILAKGKWVKIKVSSTGFHCISPSDIKQWGFGNSNNVKIFGYGGAPISLVLNNKQIDDLVQVPVMNINGHIYFYAQYVTTWKKDATFGYIQYQHPYATEAYYFVTDRNDIEQLAIATIDATPKEGGNEITSFTARDFHEKESSSPIESGNLLLGEDFRFTTSRDFEFSLPGYIPFSPVKIQTSFAAKTSRGNGSKITLTANGNELEASTNDEIPAISSNNSLINITKTIKTIDLADDILKLNIKFASTGTLTLANLDYITINYTAKILPFLKFRTESSASINDIICISDNVVNEISRILFFQPTSYCIFGKES